MEITWYFQMRRIECRCICKNKGAHIVKLSIIVPVYKVEQYLDRCLESILEQTYIDYEVILVDDGSPDCCGEMCEAWAVKDNRIKVIHKKNGGLSDARNAGINIAQGDYIGFVDSDDYIRRDMYQVLIENLEKNNADISMCGYADVYQDGIWKECDDNTVYVWNQEETIRQILLGKKVSVHAVTKLYKKELFDSVRYPVGKISEDAYIIMDIMNKVTLAVFTPRTEYYYLHRENSINTIKFRSVDVTRIEAHWKNYQYIKKKYPNMTELAYDRYLGAVGFVAHKRVMSGTYMGNVDEINMLKKNFLNIICSEYFTVKRKLSIVLMILSRRGYAILMKTIYKIN